MKASAKTATKSPKAPKLDHALRVGSSAHYDDPRYYAHAYRDRTDDVAYYVARALDVGGPVLEYGCGSGRITLPLAHAGLDVTGVDLSRPMLDALDLALKSEMPIVARRVRTHHGDMRTVALRRRFPLVLSTFNTMLHLYTRPDVEQFLARVRGHLTPKGLFVFDASVPHPSDLARSASHLYRTRPFKHPTLGARVRYGERFDYEPLRQVLHVTMEFAPESDAPAFVTPLTHRQFFPAELEALLHYNGFSVVAQQGGFDGEPLDGRSEMIVWSCRAR